MTKVTLQYITGPKDQPQMLVKDVELDQLPATGENITWADRVYKVLERAWVMRQDEQGGYMDDEFRSRKVPVLDCALLLGQIAGPPHVTVAKPSLIIGSTDRPMDKRLASH
jgi:hypothetical protein